MRSKTLRVIATTALCAALCGCTATIPPATDAPSTPASAQVSIIAPARIAPDASGAIGFAVSVRLHNRTDQPILLFAGTPCAVFRWAVEFHGETVQKEPNQLCAQVVASEMLPPHSSITRRYEIMLDRARYRSGRQYQLRYQFWRHDGVHAFRLNE